MNVKLFSNPDEANSFANSVTLTGAQVIANEHGIYVFYEPDLSAEELEVVEYRSRLRKALASLVKDRAHLEYLKLVNLGEKHEEQRSRAIEETELNIENGEALVRLYQSKLSEPAPAH